MWPTMVWSQLEFMIGIICACVPVMRPIFGKFFTHHHAKKATSSYHKMPSDEHASQGIINSDGNAYPLSIVGNSTVV